MSTSKMDILKKYMQGSTKSKKKASNSNNLRIMDEQDQNERSDSSDSGPVQRIDSDNQQSQQQKQKKILTKDQRMKKKFREALGIDQDEKIDQFLQQQLVIQNTEGIDLSQLGRKNVKLTMEDTVKRQEQYGDVMNVKFEEYLTNNNNNTNNYNVKQEAIEQDESQSDVEVDRNASAKFKTIYRNKDGTIRQQTIQTLKQKRQEEVYSKLGEWSHGMKQKQQKAEGKKQQTFGNTDISDDYKIELAQREMFDDPMRLIETTMGKKVKTEKKIFECKYSGPGNRFNIPPGHRWDGVVRGNGFEWKYIQSKTEATKRQEEEMRQYLQSL